jgi:hypothetical protein
MYLVPFLEAALTVVRVLSLDIFLKRLARHPTLQRSSLLRAFFESKEWVCNILWNLALILIDESHTLASHHAPTRCASSRARSAKRDN